jgi:hypothetical protein
MKIDINGVVEESRVSHVIFAYEYAIKMIPLALHISTDKETCVVVSTKYDFSVFSYLITKNRAYS